MADLKVGTTIGGALVWNQGNFPLFPAGNSLLYRDFTVYSTNDKPKADDNDFVSKANGGTYSGTITLKNINSSTQMMQLQGTAAGMQFNIANADGTLTNNKYQIYAQGDLLRFRGPNPDGSGGLIDIFQWNNSSTSRQFEIRGDVRLIASGRYLDSAGNQVYSPSNKPTSADTGSLPLTGGALTGDLTSNSLIKTTSQIMGGDQSTFTNNLVVKGLNAGAGQTFSFKDYQGNENVSLYTSNTDGFLNIRTKGKRIVTDSIRFKMDLNGGWEQSVIGGTSYNDQWQTISPIQINHGEVTGDSNYYPIVRGTSISKGKGWGTRVELGMLREGGGDWGKGNIVVGTTESASGADKKYSIYTFDISGNFSSPSTVSSPSIIGNYLRAKNAVDIFPESDPAFSSGSTYNTPEFKTGWNSRGAVSGGASKGYVSFYGQEEVGTAWRAVISVIGYSNKNPNWIFNETGTFVSPGTIVSNAQDSFRMVDTASSKSIIQRFDGNAYYLLFSDSVNGTWNSLRPIDIKRSSGRVGMAHGLSVSNGVSVDSGNLNVGQAFMQNDGNIYGSLYGGFIRDWVQNNAINVANDASSNRVTTCRRGGRQEQYQGEAYSWEVRNGYLTGTSNTTGDGNVRFTTWFYRVPMFYVPSRGWVEFENG